MVKKTQKRPPKLAGVLELVREHWDNGTYVIMSHAFERQGERNIIEPEIGWVITHGYHERKKDEFKPEYNVWNYAIRGKTLDERDLRIAVSFEDPETELLVITVIDLDLKDNE
jgi:hypothetical protein